MSKFQISTIQYFTYIARNYLLYLNQVIVKRKKVMFLEKIEQKSLIFSQFHYTIDFAGIFFGGGGCW